MMLAETVSANHYILLAVSINVSHLQNCPDIWSFMLKLTLVLRGIITGSVTAKFIINNLLLLLF